MSPLPFHKRTSVPTFLTADSLKEVEPVVEVSKPVIARPCVSCAGCRKAVPCLKREEERIVLVPMQPQAALAGSY
jgi:hypothetical protein